jgi:hypothetical protein
MLHNFNPAKTRRLKVYYGHQGNSYKRLPVIRLSGKYLTVQGFKIGDMVEVTLNAGQILITKIEPLTQT